MDFTLQPHLYRDVPVIFWPWVFWQLFKIALWCELTGREVMVAVAETGHVYVTRIGDDPSRWTPQVQPYLHEYFLTSSLPGESRDQWRARIEAAYAPGFGVQAWIISPRALGDVVAQICRPELPTIRDPVIGLGLTRANALERATRESRFRAARMNRVQDCPHKLLHRTL